jgi:hypothetical protein
VGLAWVFFRCRTFADSLAVVRELVLPRQLGGSVLSAPWLTVIGATLAIAWLVDRRALAERVDRAHWLLRGAVFAALLFLLTVFAATEGHVAFLYFQF